MPNERLFIVRYPDGSTSEPMDLQSVVKHAENGGITLDCKIRSTLVNKWDKALEFKPIHDILNKQVMEKSVERNDTFWTHLKARINLKVEEPEEARNGLVKVDKAAAPSAGLFLRIMAAISDILILAVIGLLYYFACAWCFAHQVLSGNNVFYFGFIVYWLTIIFYYILNIYLRLQTPGQRCWGIYLIKDNGEQFWLGRAFFYFVFMLMFGLLSPLFIFLGGSGRSLQEMLTGTRMVKIVFDESVRKK